MDLNKNHRTALIDELEKAQEDASIQKRCLDQYTAKQPEDAYLQHFYEVSHFLALQRITLIKQLITLNEMDY